MWKILINPSYKCFIIETYLLKNRVILITDKIRLVILFSKLMWIILVSNFLNWYFMDILVFHSIYHLFRYFGEKCQQTGPTRIQKCQNWSICLWLLHENWSDPKADIGRRNRSNSHQSVLSKFWVFRTHLLWHQVWLDFSAENLPVWVDESQLSKQNWGNSRKTLSVHVQVWCEGAV